VGFLRRVKRSPWFSLILGIACLVMTGLDMQSGVLHYKGKHYAGNWDYYFLLVFFTLLGLGLTGSGIWGTCRPSPESDWDD
jgi:hypothetical protein